MILNKGHYKILPSECNVNLKNTMCLLFDCINVHTKPISNLIPQLPQDIRKTNKRLSFSTRVIPTTSASRPKFKSNQLEDRVMPNNSHGKMKELVEMILFIVDSGCSKHMTGNLKLLSNFVEKLLGTMKFRNDQIALILGYGDLRLRPQAWFWSLMAKASSSQAWLWHRRLSHLNFDTINLLSKYDIVTGLPKLKFVKDHLCSSCELGKAKQGIEHQTSIARTPEQNGIVERQNHTLVEAARTMLSAAKVPLFFWAEAISISCFTQNRSLVIPRHEKTPYHIINGWKPFVKCFYIFGSLCYIVKDGENLTKMKEKGDACIFVRYSTQSRAYRVYNKRTKVIVKTIHVNFEELPQMASDHVTAETVSTSNELDLLFSSMFNELLNGTTQVVSKSSVITATDAPNQRQQQHTTPSTLTTIAA
ncbi:integrase, catalytic region, zinc finger, CCHC-type containing protein, partial [Tanacetum coccineum]